MSSIYIAKCDICGHEARSDEGNEQQDFITASQKIETYSGRVSETHSHIVTSATLHLCPTCAGKVGIIRKSTHLVESKPYTTAEQVFNLLEQIISLTKETA